MLRGVLVSALMLGACAHAPTRTSVSPAHLVATAPIAAPEGLAEYCARTPSECGVQPQFDLRGLSGATGGSTLRRSVWSPQSPQASMFHALLSQRQARPEAGGLHPLSTPLAHNVDAVRLEELHRINRQINRAIRPREDREAYGLAEYWSRPIALYGRGAVGDCEDYALEKRAALLAAGWPARSLSLAVAISPRVGLHAVLIVSTDQGDYVLDNLYQRAQPIAALDYVWLSRQSGPGLMHWASVRLSNEARSPRDPAEAFHDMLRARIERPEPSAPALPARLEEIALQSGRELFDIVAVETGIVVKSKPGRGVLSAQSLGPKPASGVEALREGGRDAPTGEAHAPSTEASPEIPAEVAPSPAMV